MRFFLEFVRKFGGKNLTSKSSFRTKVSRLLFLFLKGIVKTSFGSCRFILGVMQEINKPRHLHIQLLMT